MKFKLLFYSLFVTIFIFFFSFFIAISNNGINLKNLYFKNYYINHLFIKYNIYQNNFEVILNNIKYSNYLIKNLSFLFFINNKKIIIKNLNTKFYNKQIDVNNTLTIYYKNKKIFLDGYFLLNNIPIFLNTYINLNKNIINSKFFIKKFNYLNTIFYRTKFSIIYYIKEKKGIITAKKINLLKNKSNITVNKFTSNFDLKHKILKNYINNIYINHLKINNNNNIIKNININNIYNYIYIPTFFSYIKIKNLNFNFKDIYIKLLSNEIIFQNKKNFLVKNEKMVLKNNKKINITVFNKGFYFYKFYNYQKLISFNNKININNKKYKGNFYIHSLQSNLNNVFINNIIGKFLNINLKFYKLILNLKKEKLNIKKILLNKKISVNNFNIKKDKKNYLLSFQTNSLFNKNLKEILKNFIKNKYINNIEQIKGNNKIFINLLINKDLNNINFKFNIKSKNTIFNYFNNKFKIDEINITKTNFTDNKINIELNNLSILNKYIINNFNNIKLNITKKSINGIIKKIYLKNSNFSICLKNTQIKHDINKNIINIKTTLNIDSQFLKLKNFKELITIINNNIIIFKNLNLILKYNKKIIYINNTSNLINYSILKNIIKNINLIINNNNISSYIYIKKPIFFINNKKIKKLNLNISINNKNYLLENKYLKINISNKNNIFKIKGKISDLSINIKELENLILKKKENNKKNNNIKKIKNQVEKRNKNIKLNINLILNNSNIIYGRHKFLSRKTIINYNKINNKLYLYSRYKNSYLKVYNKQKEFYLIEMKNLNKNIFNSLFPKFNSIFKKLNSDIVIIRNYDNFYSGKLYINYAEVKSLKGLNNVVAFINLVPSLLSLSSPGFSSKGYKIKDSFIRFLFYNNILYLKNININGKNLSFKGKGYIDLNKNFINLKIIANLKMKIKKIPILGKGLSYLFFGKDGNINIKLIIKGDLKNPKVEKDIGQNILLTPFDLFKRAITLPFNIF